MYNDINELEEKIYNGEDLSPQELQNAVFGCDEVCTKYGIMGRWNVPVSTVIKIRDKLFCIDWYQGLTEYQENIFDEQPYEVEEIEETITVKKYIQKK